MVEKKEEKKEGVEEKKEKPVKLRRHEKRKLRIINRLIAGEINGPKAAKMLKITTRQVRNLKRQVLEEGELGVVHKNRFHKPVNTYEEDIRKELAHIYRTQYRKSKTSFSEFARIMQSQGYELSEARSIISCGKQNPLPQRKRKREERKPPTRRP